MYYADFSFVFSILKHTTTFIELSGKILVVEIVQVDLFPPPVGCFDQLEGSRNVALVDDPSPRVPIIFGIHETIIVSTVV